MNQSQPSIDKLFCAAEVRERVQQLLRAHSEAGSFLEFWQKTRTEITEKSRSS